MSDTENCGDSLHNDENCRLCGLQSFKVLSKGSADSLSNVEDCPCFIRAVIAFLHEQILGCKENDESTKPKVSLSLCNEFLKSQEFENLKKQYDHWVTNFTDLPAYRINPLDAEFKPVNTLHFEYIKTKEELTAMIDDLLKCCEIAVSLEYYSIRSYLGFTWLLQISTTKTNYFVDCLKLETEVHILNEVFMSVNILKIFYRGKDSILKLQKDFGILIINVFDISHIHLILRICQQAELLENSVLPFLNPKHTYLLLYIKAYLTNLLLKLGKSSVLKRAQGQSKKMYDQVYRKPEWNDKSALRKVGQKVGSKKAFAQEIYIVKQLLIWRSETAKKEDEPLNFIFPNDKILKCAKELLTTGYSDPFHRYCNAQFSANGKIELNINEMIKTAKQYGTQNLDITSCLSENGRASKSCKLHPVLQDADQNSDSQLSEKK